MDSKQVKETGDAVTEFLTSRDNISNNDSSTIQNNLSSNHSGARRISSGYISAPQLLEPNGHQKPTISVNNSKKTTVDNIRTSLI